MLDSGAGAHVSLEVLDNGVEIRCDMIIGMNNERMELNNNNTTTHLSQNTVNEIQYFRLRNSGAHGIRILTRFEKPHSSQAHLISTETVSAARLCSDRNGLNAGRLGETLFCDGHHIAGGKS